MAGLSGLSGKLGLGGLVGLAGLDRLAGKDVVARMLQAGIDALAGLCGTVLSGL